MSFIFFNGELIHKNKLSFYPLERFRYADSLFESILGVDEYFPLLQYHQNRLNNSCDILGLDHFFINEELLIKLKNKNHINGLFKVRVSIVRAEGKLYQPEGTKCHSLVETHPLHSIFTPIQKLGFYKKNKKDSNSLSGLKSGSALLYVLAKQYSNNHNFDEVLISNHKNQWIETSSSNVFYVKNNTIYTPKNESACVLGVFRAFLIRNFSIKNANFTLNELLNADEIFLSNAIKGVQAVKKINDKKLKTKQTEKLILECRNQLSIF